MIKAHGEVLHFWFEESTPEQWFTKTEPFDAEIRQRFFSTYEAVLAGKMDHWLESPKGYLAQVIVLDQFPRNIFRGMAKAFEGDAKALKLAKAAVAAGLDQNLSVPQRSFLYMPFMHSEDLEDHETAMKLFAQPGLEENLKFEILHKNIIERFGRYPHRNRILGRTSTPEEIEFLKEENSSF